MLDRFRAKDSLSILLKVLSSILVTELIIMLTLNRLSLEKWMSPLMLGLVDAVLLTAVTSLVLLCWVVGPIRIAEKQKQESEVKAVEEALKESENHYRVLFQQAPLGVFHYDANLLITDCNERFADLLQSPRERLVGLDMKTLKDQSVLPAIRVAIAGEEGAYEGFYRATTSPAEIWISMRTAPLFDNKGAIKGGVGLVEDITYRTLAEKESKEKVRELEKFYEMAVGRELKMKELKEEITRLKEELSEYKKAMR